MNELKLAAEFPPASREAWLKLVDKATKGTPIAALASKTYDGLTVEPLYERAKGAVPVAGRAPGAPWQVMQRVDHPDSAAANRQALNDLENGATALSLVFAGSVGGYGYGLDGSASAIEGVLDSVLLDAGIAIECELSSAAKEIPAQIVSLAKKRGGDLKKIQLRAGFDPLGLMARRGGSPAPWSELGPYFAGFVKALAASGVSGRFAVADGRVVHDAGGSEAQELGYVLACAVAYLRAIEAADIALDDARRMIFFRLAADSEQFLTMAKFRALRKLWARVEEASGLAPEKNFISGVSAWRMMTKRDPHVNMLRATMAVAAAGLGGADAVCSLPFTNALGLPDEFARRVARNTQLVLLDESSLAKVADPAAGSGGIEDLTTRLCKTAWKEFQQIERTGGLAVALERNGLQQQIAAVRMRREQALKDGKDALTGTTIFQDPNEAPARILDVAPLTLPETPKIVAFEPLAPIRLAQAFE